jgi:hypothetical protein
MVACAFLNNTLKAVIWQANGLTYGALGRYV